jgi:hypothetical protein
LGEYIAQNLEYSINEGATLIILFIM